MNEFCFFRTPLGISAVNLDGNSFPLYDEFEGDTLSVGVSAVDAPRPFLTTPIDDFSVTEGLLLCIFCALVVTLVVKIFNS